MANTVLDAVGISCLQAGEDVNDSAERTLAGARGLLERFQEHTP
jgi:hypothetical protein